MRIDELTFFRFIAAAIVVIFHFGRQATGWSGFWVAGPHMVSFFFVLSGFVMGFSYLDREIKKNNYWFARIARIMPAYLAALLLMAIINYAQSGQISVTALLLNTFLLQAWLPPFPLSINYPGWSLSVEAFFYLLFPYITFQIKAKNISYSALFAASFLLWIVTQIIITAVLSTDLYQGYPSASHDLVYFFPPTHLCSFLFGIAGALWVKRKQPVIKNEGVATLTVLMAGWILIFAIDNELFLTKLTGLNFAYGSSLFSPLFLLFILAIAICRSRLVSLFRAKPLVLLGEASYALYILQKPLNSVYEHSLGKALNLSPMLNFFVFFALLTLTSIVVLYAFEKPAMAIIKKGAPLILRRFRAMRLSNATKAQ